MFMGNRKFRKPYLILGIVVLVVSFGMLAWCIWPLPTGEQTVTLSLQNLQAIYSDSQIPDFLKNEIRQLVVTYPSFLRKGETGHISLRWEVASPSTSTSGVVSESDALVETRLELFGFILAPSDNVVAPLFYGQTLLVQWSVLTGQSGQYSGTIWSYLNLPSSTENTAANEENYQPVAVQELKLEVIDLLGFGYTTVLWIGGIGIGAGLGLVVFARYSHQKPVRKKGLHPNQGRRKY
jgi:hypothetical protein